MAFETMSLVFSLNSSHNSLHLRGVINVFDGGTCIGRGKSENLIYGLTRERDRERAGGPAQIQWVKVLFGLNYSHGRAGLA